MRHSLPPAANTFSSSKEKPRPLWNTKIHYSTHKFATCRYNEPDRSSPGPTTLYLYDLL